MESKLHDYLIDYAAAKTIREAATQRTLIEFYIQQREQAARREGFEAARVAVMQVLPKDDHLVEGLQFKYKTHADYEASLGKSK